MADYTSTTAPMIANPIGIEVPIQSIQQDLASLSFIELSYGRAKMFPVKKDSDKQEPKVYVGNRNYKTVLPNDNLNSQSFIAVTSHETIEEFDHNSKSQIKKCDLAIIIWVNFEKLDKFNDIEDFENFKSQVEQKLAFNPYIIDIDSVIDENAKKIFSPYDIDQCEKESLQYPYGGMRFDVKIGFESFCQ